MICSNCDKPIQKTAVVTGGLFFCSFTCRDDVAKTTNDIIRGVGIPRPGPRKISQSEIRKKMRPKEGDISSNAAGVLDRRGVYNTRLQSGKLRIDGGHFIKLCKPGTPDRMFADGLICFLELKRPGEDLRPDQREVAADLKANGALVFTIDDFEQTEFVVAEMVKRSQRIEAIAIAIQEIQKEIDSAFNTRFKCEK